jgi:glycosyltransferase involved in cell wall biosynthesis
MDNDPNILSNMTKLESDKFSSLFDARWYVERYPDVAKLDMDPWQHYAWIGAMLGRSPAPGMLPIAADILKPEAADPKNANHQNDRLRLKVAIVVWDVGHNPLGRAYLLAEALSRRFEVVLIGPSFPRFGLQVWEPVRTGRIKVISFLGRQYPEFGEDANQIAEKLDCDVILACKPRIPSLHLALLMKRKLNRPIILDIDDHELSFAKHFSSLDFLGLQKEKNDLVDPASSAWTRYADTLIGNADEILVSNEALQQRYGGTIIPHARDELIFDPSLYNRENLRAELGLAPSDRLVLFAGTARAHKGIVEIGEALSSLNNNTYKLGVLGTVLDRGLKKRIEEAGAGRVIFIPNQPLDRLPRFLIAADLVCLLQNVESSISQFQLPAKLIDALALGVPVLATETPPLRRFVEMGIVQPVNSQNLAASLDKALKNAVGLRAKQLSYRTSFLSEFSYRGILPRLEEVIIRALANARTLDDNALDFEDVVARLPRSTSSQRRQAINPSGRYDVVMFWRQNDSGLYGRRSDMLAKYFARNEDVRQVLLIDHPVWCDDLLKRSDAAGLSEASMVYKEIVSRSLGFRDTDRLTHHTFVYHPRRHPQAVWSYPSKEGYLRWLQDIFTSCGVSMDRAIFWLFPNLMGMANISKHFKPHRFVCDIVDDMRTHVALPPAKIQARDENYRELLGLADLAVTNALPVLKSLQGYANDMRLLPNACEPGLAEPGPGSDLERLLSIPSPRIGYVGNLESKLDLKLIEEIATQRPDWNIVLVGSTHSRPELLTLRRFKNVHFMGVVRYEDVRVWIRNFDVAIMPHIDSALTNTMNPLKLFVYLSQHRQVITTPVANIDEVRKYVRTATGSKEFIVEIESALSNNLQLDWNAVDRHLQDHSWEVRVNAAMEWLKNSDSRMTARTAIDGQLEACDE